MTEDQDLAMDPDQADLEILTLRVTEDPLEALVR